MSKLVAWYTDTVNLYLDSSSAFVSEDLNFKSLHFNQNFGLFLVAFSISVLIFDLVMSFSVNYRDNHCVQNVINLRFSSLVYLFA